MDTVPLKNINYYNSSHYTVWKERIKGHECMGELFVGSGINDR